MFYSVYGFILTENRGEGKMGILGLWWFRQRYDIYGKEGFADILNIQPMIINNMVENTSFFILKMHTQMAINYPLAKNIA